MTKKSKVSVLLTGLGAIGVVVTAVLAVKNYDIYKENIADAEHEKDSAMSDEDFNNLMTEQGITDPAEVEYLTKKEKAVIFAKSCYPALIAGVITEGCIIGAQVLDIQEIAALTGLVGVTAAKYKDLVGYLQTNYPEQYKEAMDFINAKKMSESKYIKEETYDGRYRMYEPITQQVFFSKDTPEVTALKCTEFVNAGLLNDQIVSIFDYIDNLQKISGDKNLKKSSWMHKCGWCLEDKKICKVTSKLYCVVNETFDYNSSYNPDGYSVKIKAEPFDLKDDVGDVSVVHSLTTFQSPNDFSVDICKNYDIPFGILN